MTLGGVMIETERCGSSGRSSSDLTALRPSICASFGLAGVVESPRPWSMYQRRILFPNLLRSVDAPTTAKAREVLCVR